MDVLATRCSEKNESLQPSFETSSALAGIILGYATFFISYLRRNREECSDLLPRHLLPMRSYYSIDL